MTLFEARVNRTLLCQWRGIGPLRQPGATAWCGIPTVSDYGIFIRKKESLNSFIKLIFKHEFIKPSRLQLIQQPRHHFLKIGAIRWTEPVHITGFVGWAIVVIVWRYVANVAAFEAGNH